MVVGVCEVFTSIAANSLVPIIYFRDTQAETEQMTEPVRCLATTGCYVAGWMKSFICNCHNCEDHFHLYSLAAVHSYYLYHIYTSYDIGFC